MALRAGLAFALAGSLLAQSSQTLTVSAYMDIWQSGGYDDNSGGEAPAVYSFSAAAGQALTFSSVTGGWICGNGSSAYGPDGTNSGPCYFGTFTWGPVGPFSGLSLTDFTGPLVGMFLTDDLPASAAPSLTFYLSDNSAGGIQTNFTSLSPQIGQVFFIGDGKTGTGGGAIQVFNVPPTATRLYLGYPDQCRNSEPSCYTDNAGSLTATFAISNCSYQVPNVIPQAQLADREWATQAAIILGWKTGKTLSPAATVAIADGVAPATTEFATDYADGGVTGCANLNNCSISLADYTDFLQRLTITQADPAPSACGIAGRLRNFGPMAVVIGTPTPNLVSALVLTGITGDGVASGTAVNLINPATGALATQSLPSLLEAIEPAMAAGWPEFVQFP